jgi:hypothetical protein
MSSGTMLKEVASKTREEEYEVSFHGEVLSTG